jgi:hypothetical protein
MGGLSGALFLMPFTTRFKALTPSLSQSSHPVATKREEKHTKIWKEIILHRIFAPEIKKV